jgi:hypothetical protein
MLNPKTIDIYECIEILYKAMCCILVGFAIMVTLSGYVWFARYTTKTCYERHSKLYY